MASGRPEVPIQICQKSWPGLGPPGLGFAEAPGRTFEERSLQARASLATSPSPVPGWLDQLQKGWGVGTSSPCREPEEVTDLLCRGDRKGPSRGGTCWHLPNLEPDTGAIRGWMRGGTLGCRLVRHARLLTHRGRCPVGTVNGLREEQRVGLQARKGSLRPVPGDSEHLQQPNEGKR